LFLHLSEDPSLMNPIPGCPKGDGVSPCRQSIRVKVKILDSVRNIDPEGVRVNLIAPNVPPERRTNGRDRTAINSSVCNTQVCTGVCVLECPATPGPVHLPFLVAAPIATPASDCRIVSSREIYDRSRFDILDNIGGARVHLGSHDVGEGER